MLETTFTLAKNFGVTPFEIMSQDIDAVILVINYYLDRDNGESKCGQELSEKEQAKDFWACL